MIPEDVAERFELKSFSIVLERIQVKKSERMISPTKNKGCTVLETKIPIFNEEYYRKKYNVKNFQINLSEQNPLRNSRQRSKTWFLEEQCNNNAKPFVCVPKFSANKFADLQKNSTYNKLHEEELKAKYNIREFSINLEKIICDGNEKGTKSIHAKEMAAGKYPSSEYEKYKKQYNLKSVCVTNPILDISKYENNAERSINRMKAPSSAETELQSRSGIQSQSIERTMSRSKRNSEEKNKDTIPVAFPAYDCTEEEIRRFKIKQFVIKISQLLATSLQNYVSESRKRTHGQDRDNYLRPKKVKKTHEYSIRCPQRKIMPFLDNGTIKQNSNGRRWIRNLKYEDGELEKNQ